MAKRKQQEAEEEPKKALYTLKMGEAEMARLERALRAREWEPFGVDYARFAFRGNKVNVVGYESGKVVVSGKGTEDFVTNILEPEVTGEARLGYDEVHHPEWFEAHAGMDESGKGDLFGPLISAAVIGDGGMVEVWRKAGIQDSKAIADNRILKLDTLIRRTPGVVVETTFCGMEKYNELMSRPKANLNLLLAWLHGKSINRALDRKAVPWGLLDQFSKKPLTQKYVRDREGFELRMRTKAESDPVVAAASVVARAEFLRQMDKLSELAGEKLLKGASGEVKKQAERVFAKGGRDLLGRLAKLHFKTAYEAQGLTPPEKKGFFRKEAGGE